MPKNYKVSPKAQATLLPKGCIPMYLEELKFVIYRCGWKVTKLYKHYYFEQERFKKDFILMNQKARQQSKNKIESDFCKLLNNANFGYDCRNNLDNCTFEPISDEIREISFIRRYHDNLFDKELSPFINSHILEQEITHKYNSERQKVVDSDPFFAAKIRSIENRKHAEIETLEYFKKAEKKNKKRKTLHNYSERMDAANKDRKVKTIIDFIDQDTASIKALGVKTNEKVKITTRFIKGKMLMFSKVSLKAFIYDLIATFCFPDDDIQELYVRNDILKCFLYLILTDTDSYAIKFLFVSDLKSKITEEQTRKPIFYIILLNIGHRTDTSDDFYVQFLCQNKKLKKKVGLYEVESIDNANIVTIAVNPNKQKAINKKHKGVKKSTPGMNFEAFSSRIMDIREYSYAEKMPKTITQKQFQIKNTKMQMTTAHRKKFAGLNDKRFYLSDGITSLPYGHFLLAETRDEKKQYKQIHKEIMRIKDNLIRQEHRASSKCERIRTLRPILV